jgi:hypothetical protein
MLQSRTLISTQAINSAPSGKSTKCGLEFLLKRVEPSVLCPTAPRGVYSAGNVRENREYMVPATVSDAPEILEGLFRVFFVSRARNVGS